MIRIGLLSLALLVVGGCTSSSERNAGILVAQGVVASVRSAVSGGRPTATPSIVSTGTPAQIREALAPIPGPLTAMLVPARGESAVLLDAGQKGSNRYWAAATGQIFTLRSGVLTQTRGIGHDLMSSEVDGTIRLLRQRTTGNTTRIMRYLNGEDDEVPIAFQCTVSPRGGEGITLPAGQRFSTIKMRETCVSGPLTLNNFYWIDGRGRVVQSRQWGGPEIGELVFQVLRD